MQGGRMIRALLLLPVVLLCSCTITADLYPVEGPYAQSQPVPVLKAKVHGVLGNSGKIDLRMPTGELCKGRWSSVAPASSGINVGVNVSIGAASPDWKDMIQPGKNRGEAYLIGDRGTTLEVVFFTGAGTASGFGEARDNRGNRYKVLF